MTDPSRDDSPNVEAARAGASILWAAAAFAYVPDLEGMSATEASRAADKFVDGVAHLLRAGRKKEADVRLALFAAVELTFWPEVQFLATRLPALPTDGTVEDVLRHWSRDDAYARARSECAAWLWQNATPAEGLGAPHKLDGTPRSPLHGEIDTGRSSRALAPRSVLQVLVTPYTVAAAADSRWRADIDGWAIPHPHAVVPQDDAPISHARRAEVAACVLALAFPEYASRIDLPALRELVANWDQEENAAEATPKWKHAAKVLRSLTGATANPSSCSREWRQFCEVARRQRVLVWVGSLLPAPRRIPKHDTPLDRIGLMTTALYEIHHFHLHVVDLWARCGGRLEEYAGEYLGLANLLLPEAVDRSTPLHRAVVAAVDVVLGEPEETSTLRGLFPEHALSIDDLVKFSTDKACMLRVARWAALRRLRAPAEAALLTPTLVEAAELSKPQKNEDVVSPSAREIASDEERAVLVCALLIARQPPVAGRLAVPDALVQVRDLVVARRAERAGAKKRKGRAKHPARKVEKPSSAAIQSAWPLVALVSRRMVGVAKPPTPKEINSARDGWRVLGKKLRWVEKPARFLDILFGLDQEAALASNRRWDDAVAAFDALSAGPPPAVTVADQSHGARQASEDDLSK